MTDRTLDRAATDVRSEKRRRLFELLDKKKRAARAPVLERDPLSPAQRRIWFLDRAAPGVAAFNHGAIVELAGHLDAVALRQALSEIVRRHESLRTSFPSDGDGVWQTVLPRHELALPVVDARSTGAAESEWLRLAKAVNARPFDLATEPGTRALLLRLEDERHWLLLTIHHIVFDAWSSGVLLREIGALLAAFSGGRASPLPELRLQCRGVARKSEAELDHGELSRLRRYWQTRLAGVRPMPDWPYDWPASAGETFGAGLEKLVVGETRKRELLEFCRARRMTLASVLLSGVNMLAWKYTGASDVCIGIPVAGRDSAEAEALIGCFVNTLVIRTAMDEGARLGEVVAQTWKSFSEAYVHQGAAFDDVVRWTRQRRAADETPLFRILFNYRNVDMEAPDLGGLKLRLLQSRPESMLLDLSVEVADRSDGFEIAIGYRAERFRPATIARMLRQLEAILASVVASPSVALGELDVEGALGRQQKREWNATEEDWGEPSLAALWERRASESPDAVALSWEDESVTYAALDRQARALGAALERQGLDGGVALVWLPRSAQAVAAMLGVMRAGAAYWVLDPYGPAARAWELCKEVQPSWVVTTSEHRASLPWNVQGVSSHEAKEPRVLELDVALSAEPTTATRERHRAPFPEQLAYLMATSGSTGAPKVVAATHRGLLNRLQWMWRKYPFAAGEVVCQKTSLGFVDSVSEIWGALLAGVRLRMVSDEIVRSPRRLVRSLAEEGVTRITLVPSLLDAVLDELEHGREPLLALRYCIASGEPLSSRTAERMGRALPHVKVLNLYGATEIAGDSTWHECGRGRREGRMPIGRPIANTTVHVLSASMQRAPLGARGELYVGGVGLSRGYWGRPDLTATRFVPDPHGDAPGGRLYRTGDVGRHRDDGAIEHLGRADRQVKIRGHRVELAEVESALAEHPAVARAVVAARSWSEEPPATHLVAYLELAGDVDVRAMREFLRDRVPDYMVPSRWVEVPALPLTNTGKVDRLALAGMSGGVELGGPADDVARAPTKTERELGRIIGQVLHVAQVGPDADFFDLGGHSLAIAQVAARVRETFGYELALRALFERPKVRELAELLDGKSTHRRDQADPPIRRLPATSAPLSHAQESLWFLQQLDPGSVAYNETFIARMQGELNVAALEAGLRHAFGRHAALRTRFELVNDKPVQRVDPRASLAVQRVDAAPLSSQRDDAAAWLAGRAGAAPFDLSEAPLVRVWLLHLGLRGHAVVLSVHHIVADAWSMRRLTDDVVRAYRRLAQGLPLDELESGVRYIDYAAWQRDGLGQEKLREQIEHWRRKLAGVTALDLGAGEAVAHAAEGQRVDTVDFRVPEPVAQAMKELARGRGATPFMAALGAWMALLSAASGHADVSVGCPIADRPRRELEDVVGLFVNTLVMRCHVRGGASFHDLLEQVRGEALEAYAHQDCPFELLVRELRPHRRQAHNPLFDVMFVFHPHQPGSLDLSELDWSLTKATSSMPKADWVLTLAESPHDWAGSLEFDAGRHTRVRAQRMVRDFVELLSRVVRAPARPLAELSVHAFDRHQTEWEWNETREDWGGPTPAEMWERRASESPDAVALSWGEAWATYGALDQQARALGQALEKRGLEREGVVLVWLPRSPQAVVAMLGVMGAGGAHWVLDPSGPAARARELLREVKPRWVVTTREHRATLPCTAQVIELDALPAGELADRRGARPAAEQLAYVMATSGSTGAPKVVMATHRGLSNRLHWMWKKYPFEAAEVGCQKTSLAFVDSMSEIFAALLAGVPLRMLSDDTVRDPGRFVAALSEGGVTRLTLVPSLLEAMLDEVARAGACLPALRHCVASGEPLPRRTAERMGRVLPHVKLLNLYGATEIAGDSTWHECERAGQAGRMSVGRPIANTTVHVLNASLQSVPLGARGELYVGGDGVARGYLGRPDLTAIRFVPNPNGDEPGSRLYRTGDIGHYRDDGTLEHLGRADRQVKIRGHRVELAEVESALLDHSAVARAAVVARPVSPDDPATELVAYLELSGEVKGVRAMREFLRARVPEYMVPSKWIELRAMPLTTSGKVDRTALDAAGGVELGGPGALPLRAPTRTEIELGRIIGEVLRVPEVRPDADFFDLGGHSLAVVQVAARVRESLALELPLRAVFERPNVRDLAELLDAAGAETQGGPIRRLESPAAPLSHAQESLWFLQRLDPASVAYNETFVARMQGELNVAALATSLRHVLGRHAALCTRFELVSDEPEQRVDEGASPRVVRLDASRLGSPGDDGATWVAARGGSVPFDLSRAPLVRVWLVHLGLGRHAVVLSVHHIVADAWSMRQLTDDVALAYRRVKDGLPLPEPEPGIRYLDYAAWQRERLGFAALREQIRYWRAKLAGAAALELAGPEAPPAGKRVDAIEFFLPRETAQAMKDLARARGVTPFMAVLGAWMALLAAASGQTDVPVGCPVANRPRRELESVVGLFVNTLVMRCQVNGAASFHDLLEQVRSTALEAYAHQDCPFEHLVRELHPRREGTQNPLFDVMFVFLPHQPGSLELAGLDWSLKRAVGSMPKADWVLTIAETPGDWAGSLEFDAGRHQRERALRLVRDFIHLLAHLTCAPARPLVDLAGLADIVVAPPRPVRPLPVAAQARALERSDLVAPSTAVELALAEICRTLLRRDEIGMNLTFFELGGHSLLAVKFHLAIEKAFPQTISLQDLFDDLPLSALAKRIEAHGRPAEGGRTVREIDF